MAKKKTREQLLKEARERQRIRERSLRKTQELQQMIPRKIPGVPTWATAMARNPVTAEVAQLAFSQRLMEAAYIEALKQTQPSVGSVAREVIQDESRIINQDAVDLVRSLVQIDWGTGADKKPLPPRPGKQRSPKQMMNDSIQADALKSINKRARKKDGSFKKGWDQRKVMILAQKECTKERERLGLCKRKSTRKGQKRKTARRAYEK